MLQSQHLMAGRAGTDRRSGLDRRVVYDLEYFERGGFERRTYSERREFIECRSRCVRISPWSSARKH